MSAQDVVARLRELDAKATKGPWHGPDFPIMSREHGEGSGIHGPRSQGIVEAVGYLAQPVEDDLRAIVALRNALLALANFVEEADRSHNEGYNADEYDAALAALERALGEPSDASSETQTEGA